MPSQLSVSLHEVQFAKDGQYYLSVTLDNQKVYFQLPQRRTDTSAIARNPVFTTNTLLFNLTSTHTVTGTLHFSAFMLSEENQSKTLGECSLDITPFALQPSEVYNLPIRQQMKLMRTGANKLIAVGRFIVSLKVVQQEALPLHLDKQKIDNYEIFHQLPDYDLEYTWRVKVEIRYARNLPYDNPYVEVGWVQMQQSSPVKVYSTQILCNRNPQWHQTFLIYNPLHCEEPKGFIAIGIKDNTHLDQIIKVRLPLQSMSILVPYNIKAIENEQSTQMQLYFSTILQTPISKQDKLIDILVSDVVFQPLTTPFKSMHIAAVVDSPQHPSLRYRQFSSKNDSIDRLLQFDQTEQFTYLLSNCMRVPPVKSSRYHCACVLTLSLTMLRKSIHLFIVANVDKQLRVVGQTEITPKDMNALVQRSKKQLFLAVHPHTQMGACTIQVRLENQQTHSVVSQPQYNADNNSIAKEVGNLSQNNQIINRLLKALADKSESLKQAAIQISNLRGRVKLLQNENSILRHNATKEEDQLVSMVQREVENMSQRDLKQKIVKLSQLYKAERSRCKELDRTVQSMEPHVANAMQLNSMILSQKNSIQSLNDKIGGMQREQERINVYKDTIKKQEKVIVKLEQVMREGIEDVRAARGVHLEGKRVKELEHEVEKLQGIIANAQDKQYGSSRGSSRGSQIKEGNMENQFKLQQAHIRITSLEEEIQERAKAHAREIATYKMKIAEKQAIMNGYQ